MDFHDASALLQRELEAVTARWINIYPEPLVAVSGALTLLPSRRWLRGTEKSTSSIFIHAR
jgi:hypothetical protein